LGFQGFERVLPAEYAENLFMEILRRRAVAVDPVDFVAVSVQEEEKRRPEDAVFGEVLFAYFVSPAGPIQDEIIFEELSELGIAVILLTQQFAAPSAA